MICTGINQDFKRVVREIKVLPPQRFGQFSTPQAMSIIYIVGSTTGIMEYRKQFYYGFINPCFFRKQKTIFFCLFPVPWAMY